ncbi:hypothetical protein ITJ64_17580 [Herbiconiux sp. VKM Ac-1786]|uniref:hypothetical protein n=1 Tax=Herbiconiux sp. VKM Ac-1786 TaxID=2783824 RepID=UPI00188A855F|nr:hypothetical protein [Herbiconiux sp. VKM Ac-1786]MBF4574325.1 hypothetical protein [Herbiconiux sp. VKM Ac-1786]
MTTVVLPPKPRTMLAAPVKGIVAVVLWVIAIALWVIAPNMTDPRWGAFLIDIGIVLASVGFAAPTLTYSTPLRNTIIAGVAAIALFALGDLGEILVISYMLRILVPLLALFSALYAVVGRVRVWYN